MESDLINILSNSDLSGVNIILLAYLYLIDKRVRKLEKRVCN